MFQFVNSQTNNCITMHDRKSVPTANVPRDLGAFSVNIRLQIWLVEGDAERWHIIKSFPFGVALGTGSTPVLHLQPAQARARHPRIALLRDLHLGALGNTPVPQFPPVDVLQAMYHFLWLARVVPSVKILLDDKEATWKACGGEGRAGACNLMLLLSGTMLGILGL
jgi:hypothetical protein